MSDAEDREWAEELSTLVTQAVMRELMVWRRGIRPETLRGMSGTLPLVIEAAVCERMNLPLPSGPTDVPPYAADERVEVWDALQGSWRDATVVDPGSAVGPGVLVKVSRIAQPVWLRAELIRRPARYIGSIRGRLGAHYDD